MLSNSLLTLVNFGALFFPLARTEIQLSVEHTMRWDEIYIVPDNGNCKTHTLNRHLGHPNCEPEGQ